MLSRTYSLWYTTALCQTGPGTKTFCDDWKHSWKQTPLSPNLANRCCKQGTRQQTTFTEHWRAAITQWGSSWTVFVQIIIQHWLESLRRHRRTAAHLMGENFRRSRFIAWSVGVLFDHSWKFCKCAEKMATRQERERGIKRNGERERRVRSAHAWRASKAARVDLWEPGIFTLGTRLLRCSERLLPGDWSHPPGSLHPRSPPPLQTRVCDSLLSLPPVRCMKSTATHTCTSHST